MSGNQQLIQQLQQQLKIQDTTTQINQMISQSADALTCGPNCQKTRKEEQLKQQYLDAQANVNTAPAQLETAAKNYYTYAQGTSGYNKYLTSQAAMSANSVVASATNTYSSALQNVQDLTKSYDNLTTTYNNSFDLYKKYLSENAFLQASISEINTDTVTSDRKSFYESQSLDHLNAWHSFLKWMYIFFVVVYFIGLLLTKSSYSLLTRILILIAFIIYPFVINYFVAFFYNSAMKLKVFFNKT
jgi:Mn2+/Fe2+ NRAMP family transporter